MFHNFNILTAACQSMQVLSSQCQRYCSELLRNHEKNNLGIKEIYIHKQMRCLNPDMCNIVGLHYITTTSA